MKYNTGIPIEKPKCLVFYTFHYIRIVARCNSGELHFKPDIVKIAEGKGPVPERINIGNMTVKQFVK